MRVIPLPILMACLGSAPLLPGQTIVSSVNVQPQKHAADHGNEANHSALAASAVVGFVLGPDALELRAIVGLPTALHLSSPIQVAEGAARLYLPPRQSYALAEQSSTQPMAVWNLGRSALSTATAMTPIAGSLPHPDLVAFSPRGDAVALYSRSAGVVQVINGLPLNPAVKSRVAVESLGSITRLALTDDASMLAIALADGTSLISGDGSHWQAPAEALVPLAWCFLPNSHDLVVSDAVQKQVVALRNAASGDTSRDVLLRGVQADNLAVSKDGRCLIAAESSSGGLWTIDLKTGAETPVGAGTGARALSPLRDGRTFLISSFPVLSLLRVSDYADSSSASGLQFKVSRVNE